MSRAGRAAGGRAGARRRARRGTRRPIVGVVVAVAAVLAVATEIPTATASRVASAPGSALARFASAPQDRDRAPRRLSPFDRRHVTSNVFLADPIPLNDLIGGKEPSIAVNPRNPDQIVVMTADSGANRAGGWPAQAPLFVSNDGGRTWAKEFTVPPPPDRVSASSACPCNHSIAFGRDGVLYGSFLTDANDAGCGSDQPLLINCDVVTGATTDPTNAAAWQWLGDPVQLTDAAHAGSADQPWLTVGPDPYRPWSDLVHVGYDDFAGGPRAQVATAPATVPPSFALDTSPGSESPIVTNPGLRLAVDRWRGTLYALWERGDPSAPGTVSYLLNRSDDGGRTWRLDGSPDGIVVDTVRSDQAPGQKFGGVNAFLGGIDQLAVGPFGEVDVVYGADLAGTGLGDQLLLRRLTPGLFGSLRVGGPEVVSAATSTALPSVAVTDDGTVGILYDTFDGMTPDGLPIFSAHLARTGPFRGFGFGFGFHDKRGATFDDVVLEQFLPRDPDNVLDPRQRELGDFQQIVAVGRAFYGAFPGSRAAFGGTLPFLDPIFFTTASPTKHDTGHGPPGRHP